MANISELIRSKAAQDQQRRETRTMEKENISTMRDAAILDITADPEKYQKFLDLLGDNIAYSAGNIALTMTQLPHATKVGTTDFWHRQGRYVADEEMGSGAKVFVKPPRNSKYKGYFVGDYYDVSQTTGRPLRDTQALVDNTPRMEAALKALMGSCPVDILEDEDLEVPALYNQESLTLSVNPACTDTEIFAALAVEIAHAKSHDRGHNGAYDRETFALDADSIGYMVCRRFGVKSEVPDIERVVDAYDGYEPGDSSTLLDKMRGLGQEIGDTVERSVLPRQQERSYKPHRSR